MAANDYSRTVNITPLGTAYAWDTPPSWITITRVGTTDEWTITVSPNAGSARNAVLTVRHGNGSTTDTINVSQAGTSSGSGTGPTPTPTSPSGAGPTPTPTSPSGAGPTPTPTSPSGAGPTATPTPTATSSRNNNLTAYTLSFDYDQFTACNSAFETRTVYSEFALQVGTAVFADQDQMSIPSGGYYSDGFNWYYILNGYVNSTDVCNSGGGGGGSQFQQV